LEIELDNRLFNPIYWHLDDAFKNPSIRNILVYGGSSAGKTHSIAQNMVYNSICEDNSAIIFRKESTTIKESIYADFKKIASLMNEDYIFFTIQERSIKSNYSRFVFSGLDDPEKVKGISQFRRVYMNELSKFDLEDWNEVQRRLRGRPNLQIVADWNPISSEHWVKKELIDKDDWIDIKPIIDGNIYNKMDEGSFIKKNRSGDTILIKTTYKDNYWIVGSPCGTYGFFDRHTIANFDKMKLYNKNDYRIYALGEWGSAKTGGEFLHAFDRVNNSGKFPFVKGCPVHVSIDNNVLPYISVSLWQVINGNLNQFHEICAADPFNTVSKAGDLTRIFLEEIGYDDIVYLYGDSSTKAGNTIDDNKLSFLDKFEEKLSGSFIVKNRVPKSNPSVSMSGEFVNEIFSGAQKDISITIDESCEKSINDYENVKKDVNGCILKVRVKNKETKQTYEEYGHLTDAMRYVCVQVFSDEYTRFSNRRKRNSYKNENDMLYFNSDSKIDYKSIIIFVMPDCNGKMIAVKSGINEYVDVLEVIFSEDYNADRITGFLTGKIDRVVFECNKSYIPIISSLRDKGHNIFGTSEYSKLYTRISANENIIKTKFRFSDNYDSINEYCLFINNMMDYDGNKNFEALNLLSMSANYINKISM
jgi:hypothetical protein